jgi:hypothetical protein
MSTAAPHGPAKPAVERHALGNSDHAIVPSGVQLVHLQSARDSGEGSTRNVALLTTCLKRSFALLRDVQPARVSMSLHVMSPTRARSILMVFLN